MGVFDSVALTTTRQCVPEAGVDNRVPAINTSFSGGGRITGSGFLTEPHLFGGVDQVVVHGDQSLLVSGKQWVRIRMKRDTEVELEELYVNKNDRESRVLGEVITKNHNTTVAEHVGDTSSTYFSRNHITAKQGILRIRELNETLIFNGNQTFDITGDYFLGQIGNRTSLLFGTDLNEVKPFRLQATLGGVLRGQVVDWSLSGAKSSMAVVDFKEAVMQTVVVGIKALDAKLARWAPAMLVVRVGGLCARIGAALGSIRF
ncbi:MAG TPA: hypothetical protein VE621_24595 [Bryobacteraceae bacterium]|jgi:hypothetical protein|nr:hypothetical protein [Bryobacteraceae bacterium]